MPGPALVGVLAFLLGACSAGCILLAILYPRMAANSLLDKRVARIAGRRSIAPAQAGAADGSGRQRSTEAVLREAEEELDAHKAASKAVAPETPPASRRGMERNHVLSGLRREWPHCFRSGPKS